MRARWPLAPCLIQLAALFLAFSPAAAQGTVSEWSRPIDITQPSSSTLSAFGIVLCDGYQNVHLFWADLSEEDAAIYYRNDVRDVWSIPLDVLVMPGSVVAELAGDIAQDSDVVHLVWMNQYYDADLYYAYAPLYAADQPRAWSKPQLMSNNVSNAAIKVSPTGVINLLYGVSDDNGRSVTVYYVQSSDGGLSWSDPLAIYNESFVLPTTAWVKADVDTAGGIHVGVAIRSQEYGVYSEVGYLYSGDTGLTWSPYKKIDDTGTTFQGVNVIAPYAFGPSEIHLTWHDPRRLHLWSTDGGKTWNGPTEIVSLGAAFGGPNEIVQDSAGGLHALTAVAEGVFSSEWTGTQWDAPQRIDDRRIDPHRQDMEVCQGNRLHVVYYDRIGDNRVWYSTREVDAPHIPRQDVPDPTPEPTAAVGVAAATAEPTADAGGPVTTSAGAWAGPSPEPSGSPWLSTLLAAGLALALVGAVVFIRLWPKWR